MLLAFSIALLAYVLWRGGNPFGVAVLSAGLAIQLGLALRLLRASVGGVGGHAEWVRDVSKRPRLQRSPAWLLASGLVAVGAAIALWR